MRQSGYKPILVSPDIHRRLTDIGRKKETFNEIITELIELRNNNVNTIPQILPKVEAPRESVIPTSKGDWDPHG
jgi:predicted CopG family antitoxin